MEQPPVTIPAEAVKGIAGGLQLMAFFTLMWTGIATGGLYSSHYVFCLTVFLVPVIVFTVRGVKLNKLAKSFPKAESAEDKAEEKRMGKWFGIIFAGEGVGIFIAINIVTNLGHPELTVPAIALVVGLHFYPMAWLFRRTIDYYLATWSMLVAIAAMILSLKQVLPQPGVLAFTGIGIAIATSCYGLYMLYRGSKLMT